MRASSESVSGARTADCGRAAITRKVVSTGKSVPVRVEPALGCRIAGYGNRCCCSAVALPTPAMNAQLLTVLSPARPLCSLRALSHDAQDLILGDVPQRCASRRVDRDHHARLACREGGRDEELALRPPAGAVLLSRVPEADECAVDTRRPPVGGRGTGRRPSAETGRGYSDQEWP